MREKHLLLVAAGKLAKGLIYVGDFDPGRADMATHQFKPFCVIHLQPGLKLRQRRQWLVLAH